LSEERWARYRRREHPEIEYSVREGNATQSGEFGAKIYAFKDEPCVRIRTIRNLAFKEEVHQPAYTMMPADKFFDVYERVETT
jgi:hypothetical protein